MAGQKKADGSNYYPVGIEFSQPTISAARSMIEIKRVAGMEFVEVEGGMFEMGLADLHFSQPPHWVALSTFWMSRNPVTVNQFVQFLDSTKRDHPKSFVTDRLIDNTVPVTYVSWEDAIAFCEWFSDISNTTVTLPTEAQWEYAARGRDSRPYPWGYELPNSQLARYGQDLKAGQPVNSDLFSHVSSPFGTVSQLGNVWEWCLDMWNPYAYRLRADGNLIDPIETNGEADRRVVRGSGWQAPVEHVHSAYRCRNLITFRGQATGFRIALRTRMT
ncbi:formylglycine-generating enzyme family protein [Acaryochloris marina]|uniref:formylglycine-generating enzyme family protein n=1 Tax=Acaryochloris marina TaxID=155978 RepID=UPI001BB08021|nr:formylglycine-generating enzyme family protein [Acaryochloris marina]QUY41897.1 formylglycine-generating enzyme family protein [Acaryochloris marina S15]